MGYRLDEGQGGSETEFVSTNCVSALPSFLAEAPLWGGFFSPRARLAASVAHAASRNYLASQKFGVRSGHVEYQVPRGARRTAIEIALSLLERGPWTIPTLKVETALADLATRELGWSIEPLTTAAGDLRLQLRSRPSKPELRHALLPCPAEGETTLAAVAEILCEQVDQSSPFERQFITAVAAGVLPVSLLSLITPQRDAVSMGLSPAAFAAQRVDFALETHRGERIVIEVDGGQHLADPFQAEVDRARDIALASIGWRTLRVASSELSDPPSIQARLLAFLADVGIDLELWTGVRSTAVADAFWAATRIARVQALMLEAVLHGAVPSEGLISVNVRQVPRQLAEIAIDDLSATLHRLFGLYGVGIPPQFQAVSSGDTSLVVDVEVWNPLLPTAAADCAVAWSRPACRSIEPTARQIRIDRSMPRFLAKDPGIEVLDELVRDLFRKDGLRRNDGDRCDQYQIIRRILTGKDVVGLLPTGAGKSLTYMLAGLLLPGMTLYVGPLISLLQDQAERLREIGIAHVAYIASALTPGNREAALEQIATTGTRFLLVSPERFLTKEFIQALSNRSIWQGDISQVVIDECHCVSEWGHEFRPAYLSLGRIARERTERLDVHAPIVALTGTASTIVLSDVLRELGIKDPAASVRAERMNRPEIALKCIAVQGENTRVEKIEQVATKFLAENPDPSAGLLVFCPFKGGLQVGVFSVVAHLSSSLRGVDVRFYVGGAEPWRDLAKYSKSGKWGGAKGSQGGDPVPDWARDRQGRPIPWDQVKSRVQRDFISEGRESYRVLVATKAFGMGIDKPSIRCIIHAVPPTSPESYYQEVGRAARDGRPAEAVLLFNDANAEITDRLLDPSASHGEAASVYDQFIGENPHRGGDFVRTFYFQRKSFAGSAQSAAAIERTVAHIYSMLKSGSAATIPFGLVKVASGDMGEHGPEVEYAIVRLMHLGVIDRYFKDYRAKLFDVDLAAEWLAIRDDGVQLATYIARHFSTFIRRYRLFVDPKTVDRIARLGASVRELYREASLELMAFVYAHVEGQRRAATRQMVELARVGRVDAAEMRARLLNYLQVSLRFTAMLEGLDPKAPPDDWRHALTTAESPQDLAELHGACQRVLESYPSHPALLFISAVSRPGQLVGDSARSAEDLAACLKFAMQSGTRPRALVKLLDWLVARKYLGSDVLGPLVDEALGLLHLREGNLPAVLTYLGNRKVRERWLASVLHSAMRPFEVRSESREHEPS